jgi:hypothetical protein
LDPLKLLEDDRRREEEADDALQTKVLAYGTEDDTNEIKE